MKFPGYTTAPVEPRWRVASTVASPVDRALFCSRIDLSSGVLTWARAFVRMRERRGMKFPGYTTAPVGPGWRVASTVASPVDRALFCSRIDLSSGVLTWARAFVRMRERRGMKFPGYKTAPVETGWCVVSTSVSPVDRARFCSRIDLSSGVLT
jgi:hypothetical protein